MEEILPSNESLFLFLPFASSGNSSKYWFDIIYLQLHFLFVHTYIQLSLIKISYLILSWPKLP